MALTVFLSLTIIINALQALSPSTLAISESLISPNAFRSGSSTRFKPNAAQSVYRSEYVARSGG